MHPRAGLDMPLTEEGGAAVPDLLEREQELDALHGLARRAASGVGSLALITGVAGIGKTALLNAAAKASGLRMLTARGGELEREFPYGVVRQLFEAPLRAAGEDRRDELLAGAAAPAAALL